MPGCADVPGADGYVSVEQVDGAAPRLVAYHWRPQCGQHTARRRSVPLRLVPREAATPLRIAA